MSLVQLWELSQITVRLVVGFKEKGMCEFV